MTYTTGLELVWCSSASSASSLTLSPVLALVTKNWQTLFITTKTVTSNTALQPHADFPPAAAAPRLPPPPPLLPRFLRPPMGPGSPLGFRRRHRTYWWLARRLPQPKPRRQRRNNERELGPTKNWQFC